MVQYSAKQGVNGSRSWSPVAEHFSRARNAKSRAKGFLLLSCSRKECAIVY